MLPTSQSKADTEHEAPILGVEADLPEAADGSLSHELLQSKEQPRDPLRPIGPERLRALREAIRNGTYPTDADVLGGLERMLEPDSESPDED